MISTFSEYLLSHRDIKQEKTFFFPLMMELQDGKHTSVLAIFIMSYPYILSLAPSIF